MQHWINLGNKIVWESNLSGDYVKHAAAAAKTLQSCLSLCDPMDCSLPGSPVPGILQAKTLQWVAISFSVHFHKVKYIYIFLYDIYNIHIYDFKYYSKKSKRMSNFIYDTWSKCDNTNKITNEVLIKILK